MKHDTDYIWMRAYAQVMFDEKGGESWLSFELHRARKFEAPQDTVYCSLDGLPYSIMDERFNNKRAEMQAVVDKMGWE